MEKLCETSPKALERARSTYENIGVSYKICYIGVTFEWPTFFNFTRVAYFDVCQLNGSLECVTPFTSRISFHESFPKIRTIKQMYEVGFDSIFGTQNPPLSSAKK